MDTIVIVEYDEEKIWEIIEKVFAYNKQFKTLDIASNETTAKRCIDKYGFDIMIIDSSCKDILNYLEENYTSEDKKIYIISEEAEENNYSFENKVISINKLDEELKKLFK